VEAAGSEKLPDEHGVQVREVTSREVPAGQSSQVSASPRVNFPASQVSQTEAEAAEYLPIPHGVQRDD
jgi:hypothetical protein